MNKYLASNQPNWEEFAAECRVASESIDFSEGGEHFASPADYPKSWFQHFTGKTHTPEVRQSISEKQKVNMKGNSNAKGHKKSKEAIEKSKQFGAKNGRARSIVVEGVDYPTKKAAMEAGYSEWFLRNY